LRMLDCGIKRHLAAPGIIKITNRIKEFDQRVLPDIIGDSDKF
jgi:hypothetical protein